MRTFREINLFPGEWTNNRLNHEDQVKKSELNKAFGEIDQELGNEGKDYNKDNSPTKLINGKSDGPLILMPPALKKVKEKFSIRELDNKINHEEKSGDELESIQSYKDHFSTYFDQENINDEESENEEAVLTQSDDFPSDEEEQDEDESFNEKEEGPSKAVNDTNHHSHYTVDTKVLLPVFLANVELEIDIFETFKLSRPIQSVSKVELSLHSMNIDVLVPSDNLFAKGILVLDIDYVSNNVSGSVQSLKVQMPWKKIIPVHWVHRPELSWNSNREYIFISPHGLDQGNQREYRERFAEKIKFHLISLNSIWNEQFIENDKILFQGCATVNLALFQKQCIELGKIFK